MRGSSLFIWDLLVNRHIVIVAEVTQAQKEAQRRASSTSKHRYVSPSRTPHLDAHFYADTVRTQGTGSSDKVSCSYYYVIVMYLNLSIIATGVVPCWDWDTVIVSHKAISQFFLYAVCIWKLDNLLSSCNRCCIYFYVTTNDEMAMLDLVLNVITSIRVYNLTCITV